MADVNIKVSCGGEAQDAKTANTKDAWREFTAPEVDKFNEWFRQPGRGQGALLPYEEELIRSYLWWKLKEEDDAASPSDQ